MSPAPFTGGEDLTHKSVHQKSAMDSAAYRNTLNRLLGEVSLAIDEDKAYWSLYDCEINSRTSFLALAFYALSNDALSHAIKVFELGRECFSYWKIEAMKRSEIATFAETNNINLKQLHKLAEKLKSVRNKTHFHIDELGVPNAQKVWISANITKKEFEGGLHDVNAILAHLYKCEFGADYKYFSSYDGADVAKIVELAHKAGVVKLGTHITIS